MKKTTGVILIIMCLIACSKDKHGQQGSAFSSVHVEENIFLLLSPKEASKKTVLRLSTVGFELSKARIVWLVNGSPVSTIDPGQFEGSTDAAKGDTIQAKAILGSREVFSNAVQIANTPPEITRLKLLPEVFKPGDTLNIDVNGSDPDGDKVTFQYVWTRNGEPAGTDSALASDVVLKRGDKISVRITPFDGETCGKSGVISREIANFPPLITDHKEFAFDGKVYTYQVSASDPDDDSLTYEASSLDNGMTLDLATGLLKWNVPPEFKGSRDVSITVSDGHGGTASYSVTITIQ